MLKDSHFMQKALDSVRNDFPFANQDQNSIEINLIYGIKGTDQKEADFFDPNDAGNLIYDTTFNPAPE